MPNKLFLKPNLPLDIDGALNFEWALYDVTGTKLRYASSTSLDQIDQDLMQNGVELVDVIALWPANAALRSTVFLPGSQSRFAQQALPFAVEEQLAQDVETVHIALGDKAAEKNHFLVTTIDRSVFGVIFDSLVAFSEGKSFKGIFLETDFLQLNECDQWISLSTTSLTSPVLLKSENGDALRLSQSNLLPYLEAKASHSNDDEAGDEVLLTQIFIEESEREHYQMLLAEAEQIGNLSIETKLVSLTQFEVIIQNYLQHGRLPISLCQGEFKIISGSSQAWKKWRAVAAIAAIGFFLQCGFFIGKGVYYQDLATQVGDEAIAEYKKIVPKGRTPSVEKLPRIIKGKLNQSKQTGAKDADFLNLLGEAGFQFNKSPSKAGMQFKSINFNQQRGELVIEMQASNFSQLEQLKQAIVDAGLEAKIGSSVQEEKFFRGRISISGS